MTADLLAEIRIRNGRYEVHVDDYAGSAEPGIEHGIYNEDTAWLSLTGLKIRN